MVIDFHTHVFPDALARRAVDSLVKASRGEYPPCSDGTLSGLERAMDAFGVDISVIQPVITKASQTRTLNAWARDAQGTRIIAFGGVYPHSEDPKADVDYLCSLGLKGIKFHPEYQNFTPDDPKMMRIYDYAVSKGLILLFHAGRDIAYADCHSHPKMFADIRKSLGGGVIIAAHLGGQEQWDAVEEHLCQSGVYLDTSMGFDYYGRERFMRIVKAHGADKILFGSDSPWSFADREIDTLRALPLTEAEKDMILYKNAAGLLGI